MKKSKATGILALILAIMVGMTWYAGTIISTVGVGENRNIKLGLDLAGGVSITYRAVDENPSAEDMKDTVYKLQKRVEVYSTESTVYQEGTDRINIEIPGVSDANAILEQNDGGMAARYGEITPYWRNWASRVLWNSRMKPERLWCQERIFRTPRAALTPITWETASLWWI